MTDELTDHERDVILRFLNPEDEALVERVAREVFRGRYGEYPEGKAGAWEAAGHHYLDDARWAVVTLKAIAQGGTAE